MILFPFFRLLCCFYFSTCIGLFKDKKEIGLSRINSLLPNSLTHSLSPSHTCAPTHSLTLTLTHSRTHAPTHTLVFVRPRPRPSIGNAAAAFLSTSLFDGSRFFAEIFCCCCLRLVLPSFIHHPELNAFIFPRLC